MALRGLLQTITRQQFVFSAAALAILVLATIVSTIVSADALNERSITPSTMSVSAAAESVQYQVEFTPEQAAGAFVIEFCSNTPLLGQSCTAPTGMDVDAAATSSGDTVITSATANKIVATKTMTATAQTIVFTGLTNPTSEGVAYARIVTYANGTDAAGYTSANPSAVGPVVDSGSVALYFDESVSVSGTVLETLTFCVSGAAITANCGDIVAPVVTLGEETAPGSGVFALQPGVVSEGSLHTQINTNAASGAIVRLKSSAPCGGLMRAGSENCDIAAALNTDVVDNDNSAKFGLKTAAAPTTASGALNPIGTLQPRFGSIYNATNFRFNYDETDTTGVTSPFGDPFLDTNNAPATGQNMEVTFAATVSTNTPAGLYSTDLNMIAVGKF